MREAVKRKLKVPDVSGLQLDNAMIMLRNAEFSDAVVNVRFRESYQPEKTVLSQSPSKGQIVDADAAVDLLVSKRSWVRNLPGIYQRGGFEDPDFLREFLWIPQHLWASIQDTLETLHDHFDPYESPSNFLEWLASWVAFKVDPGWPETKKRALIKRAMELYKIRGTVKGLKVFLAIFTNYEPEIIENTWPFKGFRIGVHSTVGVDSVILPPVNLSHCFIIQIPAAFRDVTDDIVIRIHDIIMSEKPAHAMYFLRFMAEIVEREKRDFLRIGIRSGIGIGDEVTGTEMKKIFVSMGDV